MKLNMDIVRTIRRYFFRRVKHNSTTSRTSIPVDIIHMDQSNHKTNDVPSTFLIPITIFRFSQKIHSETENDDDADDKVDSFIQTTMSLVVTWWHSFGRDPFLVCDLGRVDFV